MTRKRRRKCEDDIQSGC